MVDCNLAGFQRLTLQPRHKIRSIFIVQWREKMLHKTENQRYIRLQQIQTSIRTSVKCVRYLFSQHDIVALVHCSFMQDHT
jgi:hypothetical protein